MAPRAASPFRRFPSVPIALPGHQGGLGFRVVLPGHLGGLGFRVVLPAHVGFAQTSQLPKKTASSNQGSGRSDILSLT